MIELKNVSKFYNNVGNVTVGLRNINLTLKKNEIVAITGESGSGKSTLLNVICGVDNYEEGEIYFNGNETSYFDQRDLDNYRRNNVAFIYQNYNIIDSYTTLENVMVPLLIKGYTKEEATSRALKLIEDVGLSSRIKTKGVKLSGGEKQRCVIARALASDCEILACDEPTGNLDSVTGKQIIDLIKKIAKDKLVLIVTHNYEQVADIVTRTIKISDGELIEDVIKENISADEGTDMDISEKEIKTDKLFNIALLNLKNTPKKTFFTWLVFCFYSVAVLFLILTSVAWDDRNHFTQNPFYRNTYHDRLVAFNEDHNEIDLSLLEGIDGEIYYNAFHEDYVVNISFYKNGFFNQNGKKFHGVFSSHYSDSIVNLNGELPSKSSDVYLIIPEDKVDEYSESLFKSIGEKMWINHHKLNMDLYLCGYGTSDEISVVTLYTIDDLSRECFPVFLGQLEPYYINSDNEKVELDYNFVDAKKPILHYTGPSYPNLSELRIIFKDIYKYQIDDYEIVYAESPKITASLLIPNDYVIDDVFEITIYTDDTVGVTKDLEKLGFYVIQPGRHGVDLGSNDHLFLLLFEVISVVSIILLFFISYVIVSRIYISKSKEYTILRSNGILKNQMAKVVGLEIYILALIAAVSAIIIIALLALVPNEMTQIISFVNFGNLLMFIVIMVLFSILLIRRLNRRLFKLSLATSLKGEVVRND